MSTEWIKIKSANPNFPHDTLEFVTGASGMYFCITHKNPDGLVKFWLTRESYAELKSTIDSVIKDGQTWKQQCQEQKLKHGRNSVVGFAEATPTPPACANVLPVALLNTGRKCKPVTLLTGGTIPYFTTNAWSSPNVFTATQNIWAV